MCMRGWGRGYMGWEIGNGGDLQVQVRIFG